MDENPELHTVADLEKQIQNFENFIPSSQRRDIAIELAAALDNNKVQINDLDEDGIPLDILSHKGGVYSDDKPDEVLASVLKYLELLIHHGFNRNPDYDYKYTPRFSYDANDVYQPKLKELIQKVYDFIEELYKKSKSLASYLPIKGRINNLVSNQAGADFDVDSPAFEKIESNISKYLSFLDRSAVEDPDFNTRLLKYRESLNSSTNEDLIAWDGPVEYQKLEQIYFWIDPEILKALNDQVKMSALRNEFIKMAKTIDEELKNFKPHEKDFQTTLIRFIALREFFVESKENYETWANFRERTKSLSETDSDEE